MNLQAGYGRTIYFTWLLLALVVSLICDLGLAFSSIGVAAACLAFCTLPLLVGMIGMVSTSKLYPIAAMIGSGSMVAWIVAMSDSIVREGWWWIYFAVNAIQIILAAYQFRQLRGGLHEAAVVAQTSR